MIYFANIITDTVTVHIQLECVLCRVCVIVVRNFGSRDLVSAGFIWCSEARRVFVSGLARIRDAKWLQDQLQSISTKVCVT